MTQTIFETKPLNDKVNYLYKSGSYITNICHNDQKVYLCIIDMNYFEVFLNPETKVISNISPLDYSSERLDSYLDQIDLPNVSQY